MVSCSTLEKDEMKSTYFETEIAEENQSLIINEYASRGDLVNEFEEESDWIELYNVTDSVLTVSKNEWFLSDDENDPKKFPLPQMTIEPHGFVLVWCDGRNSIDGNIHTNFKISADNEIMSLYHQDELRDQILCEKNLKKKFSFGRESDGTSAWVEIKNPSPGKSNSNDGLSASR